MVVCPVSLRTEHGLDVSQEMVSLAEEKAIYRNLKVFDPSTEIPINPNQYKIITAILILLPKQIQIIIVFTRLN